MFCEEKTLQQTPFITTLKNVVIECVLRLAVVISPLVKLPHT